MFKKSEDYLMRFIDLLVIIFFAAVVILVLLQVYTRYFTTNSITWAEELGRFLMIWMIMLSSVALYCRHGHVWVELFIQYLPYPAKKFIIIFGYLLIITFFSILVGGTAKILSITWKQLSPALGMPMGIPYISVPFCSLLMALFTLRDLIYEVLTWKGGHEI